MSIFDSMIQVFATIMLWVVCAFVIGKVFLGLIKAFMGNKKEETEEVNENVLDKHNADGTEGNQ